ncbi:MAG TPA: amidohydrolase [Bacteroidales bacterium]|jgi:predicted amidohydrolase|nr:amidohydrolase [Bacteroidales bacterium]
MSENLNVSCIQTDLVWENTDQNLKEFTAKFDLLPSDSELVILPEMYTTGFSMNPEKLAEKMNGKSFIWMKEQSARIEKIIVGSLIIKEDNKYFNRLIAMFPNGEYFTYDKRHLFRMGKEHEHYSRGESKIIFKHKSWRICPLVCYDLRFPVWSRNKNNYDLLIYVANWPDSRREVWKSLLVARALENQAYVIGVNRVGEDGESLSYAGDTMIISPKGKILRNTNEYQSEIMNVEISLDELNQFREKFPVMLDADDFKIL